MKKVCSTCYESKNASPSKSSQFSWRKDRNRYDYDCKTCRNAKKRARENKRLRVDTEEQEAIEHDPHGHLAADIVALAIQDLRIEKTDELLSFFASRWFEELCDACNVDADVARKHLGV